MRKIFFLLCLILVVENAIALSEPPENITQYLEEYEIEFEQYNTESWFLLFTFIFFVFIIIMSKTKIKWREL